jgi:hypothetical protein
MFPLPPRPMDTRYGVVTTGCSPLLLLLDVMAGYNSLGLSITPVRFTKCLRMVGSIVVRKILFRMYTGLLMKGTRNNIPLLP